jgi:hypothetical protein
MSFDTELEELMFDTVTIEAFTGTDTNQASTFATGVSYKAQVIPSTTRIISQSGREVESTASVIIPERLSIDHRSRITLPSGFVPRTPPIQKVEPMVGLGLDHTRIWL